MTLQSFTAEQEKLHDNYEQKKKEITDKVESLHDELEKLETDSSTDPRQAACTALSCAINQLIQRTPQTPAQK